MQIISFLAVITFVALCSIIHSGRKMNGVPIVKAKSASNGNTQKVKKLGLFQFETDVVWFNAIAVLTLHIAGLTMFFMAVYKWIFLGEYLSFVWSVFVCYMMAFGVALGAHRLWTHRAFKAKLPLQIILMLLFTASAERTAETWVAEHRVHHKFSDTDADPHNARRGFFFSHVGWIMSRKHPLCIEQLKKVDVSDIKENPVLQFQKKYYVYIFTVVGILIPCLVPIYFWNEDPIYSFLLFFGRLIFTWNFTWCVNSVAHFYGTRPYNKSIQPVESRFTSIITVGEGWHNYHHQFPWDYKASELGGPYNLSSKLIDLAAKIGWAYDLRTASPNVINAVKLKLGDGTCIVGDEARIAYGPTVCTKED